MRLLSRLLAIALVFGLTGVASAVGFQMVVVDPPSYVNIITSPDLTITLEDCHAGQVPHDKGDPSYDGCYTGLNDTGKPLTSLELLIPVIAGITSPTCNPAPGDIFTILSCNGKTADGKDYIIDFSGGLIPTATDCDNDGDGGSGLNSDDLNAPCNADTIFTIAESGIPAGSFPVVSVVGNAPEPNSFLLLSTGVLSVGLFFGNWRRRTHCRTRG